MPSRTARNQRRNMSWDQTPCTFTLLPSSRPSLCVEKNSGNLRAKLLLSTVIRPGDLLAHEYILGINDAYRATTNLKRTDLLFFYVFFFLFSPVFLFFIFVLSDEAAAFPACEVENERINSNKKKVYKNRRKYWSKRHLWRYMIGKLVRKTNKTAQ